MQIRRPLILCSRLHFGLWYVTFGFTISFFTTTPAALLTHRYPFTSNATDVVGTANGTLQGATVTDGALVLNGGTACLLLPADLFTNYDSVSFEAWFVDLVNLGTTGNFYNFSGSGGRMSYFSSAQGAAFSQGGYTAGATSQQIVIPASTADITNHFVWTQDSSSQTARIFINGLLAGENTNFTLTPITIGSTTGNCIGSFSSVSTLSFRGRILEFRIHQGALSPLDVAQSYTAGPDEVLADAGVLQNVRCVVPASFGPGALLTPVVYGDFANLTNVNIVGIPELVLTSDNTNAVQVTSERKLRTIGLGTAILTATYQGFSNSVVLTVVVPRDFALAHRYSFSEPSASGSLVAHDTAGANGRLIGGSGTAFNGKGELNLNGTYVSLPPGLISRESEVTVEAWLTWTGETFGNYGRIFDFGDRTAQNGGWGRTYFYLTPDAFFASPFRLRSTVSTNTIEGETPILSWSNTLALNVTSHVAVAYSPVRGVAKLYLNGSLVDSDTGVIPLAGINDTNNWLGRSQFQQDAMLTGRYSEFRIYSGLLSDADIAADYALGPDVIGSDFLLHFFVSNTNLVLTWGASAANWTLESASTVGAGAVWTQVPQTPTNQNSRFSVTVPMSDDIQFFRLHN